MVMPPLLLGGGGLLLMLLLAAVGRYRPRLMTPLCRTLLALWALGWLTLLLTRTPTEGIRIQPEPLRTLRLAFRSGRFRYGKMVSRALQNVLAFVPLGLLCPWLPGPLRRRPLILALLLGLGCSLLI